MKAPYNRAYATAEECRSTIRIISTSSISRPQMIPLWRRRYLVFVPSLSSVCFLSLPFFMDVVIYWCLQRIKPLNWSYYYAYRLLSSLFPLVSFFTRKACQTCSLLPLSLPHTLPPFSLRYFNPHPIDSVSLFLVHPFPPFDRPSISHPWNKRPQIMKPNPQLTTNDLRPPTHQPPPPYHQSPVILITTRIEQVRTPSGTMKKYDE